LRAEPADFFRQLQPMVDTYPHLDPFTKKPFDLYFGGFLVGYDPNDSSQLFSSDKLTAPGTPGNGVFPNFIGFRNAEITALIDDGIRTYDQRERARIYRSLQLALAREQPYLFAYAPNGIDLVSNRLISTAGSLNLQSPAWF